MTHCSVLLEVALEVAWQRSDVGSADTVADRIAAIERQKDGNFTTDVLFAKDISAGDVQTYLIEYRCDTSRGGVGGRKSDILAVRLVWTG